MLNEKIYVIAGNYTEFKRFRQKLQDYMYKEHIDFTHHSIVHVSNRYMLYGLHDIWGYRVGTWNQRDDLKEIEYQVRVCGSTFNDFIEVSENEHFG